MARPEKVDDTAAAAQQENEKSAFSRWFGERWLGKEGPDTLAHVSM
jgi:hypothetical protein